MNLTHTNSKRPNSQNKLPGIIITYIVIIIICSFIGCSLIDESRDVAKKQAASAAQMKALGINENCDVSISQSINTTTKMNGSFILFSGSISSDNQDNIRIGYNAKNAESYILNIPVRKIVFKRDNNLQPSAKIVANWWDSGLDIQGNLEKNLQKVEVTLTYDMYDQLLKK